MVDLQEIGERAVRSRPHPPMTFTNVPNHKHEGVYISRSMAVVVVPFFGWDDRIWIPLGLRSEKVSDSGKESLICGYLDWWETLDQCAVRESWEELGLNLYQELICKQPYHIMSDPAKDGRQNICARFRSFTKIDRLPDLFPSDEVVSARWVLAEEAVKLPLAFNHDRVIADSIEWAKTRNNLQGMLKTLNGEFSMPAKNTPDWHMRHRI